MALINVTKILEDGGTGAFKERSGRVLDVVTPTPVAALELNLTCATGAANDPLLARGGQMLTDVGGAAPP
ncbi:MAG: hypothetical protein WCT12_19150 [Verrucomicrobiota bacterium]